MAQYQHKYIITRNKMRHYQYDITLHHDYERKEETMKKGQRKEGIKSTKSINRVKDNLVLTIQANITEYSKFLTLTTAKPCLDRDQFLQYFKIFKIYFKRQFGYSLSYVGVLERQKKRGKKEGNEGSIHAHLVVFNKKKLDFKKLKKCWKFGSVDIKKIDSVDNLGVYMAKYLTKDNLDEFNKKLILKSRKLKNPTVLYARDELDFRALTGEIESPVLLKRYEKKYLVGYKKKGELVVGNCTLTDYIIKNPENQIKK